MQSLTLSTQLIQQVVNLARRAGEAIMEIYNQADVGTVYKEDNSPLTQADLVSHRLIVGELTKLTPDLPVLSEESRSKPYEERRTWSRFWLVDPIDGTKEFIKRNGEFTVNIALIEDGEPVAGVVHAPAVQTTYWSARGLGAFKQTAAAAAQPIRAAVPASAPMLVVASRSHSGAETEAFLAKLRELGDIDVISIGSSLKLCLVAEGAAHLYPRYGPTMEWDTAAAHSVVVEAGGTVTNLKGETLQYNKADLLNPYFAVLGDLPPELRAQIVERL
ncbi:MAG: 3'(2'),5'-bisphosphate nucleotidase CysQ [Aphanocapsa lilacina HA4352-LM1]|jgi:3'(2'), 5'-bisphosphate nucleotidase|nr:3'(2'),5'-bisphosphate nucleotidase CysQ [Aphanocapsa lilacina HA4352-LM1]